MSSYYAVHSVEPLHPFDITEATFLTSPITSNLFTMELFSVQARMLQKCEEDLAEIHNHVLVARYTST